MTTTNDATTNPGRTTVGTNRVGTPTSISTPAADRSPAPSTPPASASTGSPRPRTTPARCTGSRAASRPTARRRSPPKPGRYHIYSGWFCPWAQRVTIAHALAGLDDVISVSYVDGARDGRGWAFRRATDRTRSTASPCSATPTSSPSRASTGTCRCRRCGTASRARVVSNQFRTIGIDLATQFGALATPVIDTYPAELADDIEQLDAWIGPNVNRGVNAVAAARGRRPHGRDLLLDTFRELDQRLARTASCSATDSPKPTSGCSSRSFATTRPSTPTATINPGLAEYPNLWAYARDLYAIPAFRDTTDFTSFSALTSWTQPANRGDQLTAAA